MMVTRRSFGAAAGTLLTSCAGRAREGATRLHARPGKAAKPLGPGTHPLRLREQRDAILYVPESVAVDRPAPLVVYLHGATGDEQQGLRRLGGFADKFRFI